MNGIWNDHRLRGRGGSLPGLQVNWAKIQAAVLPPGLGMGYGAGSKKRTFSVPGKGFGRPGRPFAPTGTGALGSISATATYRRPVAGSMVMFLPVTAVAML